MQLKKIGIGIASIALAFAFAACGGNSATNTTTTSAPPPPATTATDTSTDTSTAATDTYGLQVKDTNGDGLITLGFSQVGAESGWRIANTQSYQDFFVPANGYKLVFVSANNDADKQKQDVRDLINNQDVEVIDVAPVTDSGWEPILQEAKDAGIPLIVSDRQLMVDDGLYLTYFGGNMLAEGQRACDWLKQYITDNNMTDVSIVHLQGTIGSTAQVGRSQALTDALAANSSWNVVYEQTGNFTQTDGQTAMEAFLNQNKPFTILYSENDDMTYGAIDAMKNHGLDPKNYVIISFDGNKSAVQMVIDGIINVIGQCNPLLGPQVGQLIQDSMAGKAIPKVTYSDEVLITPDNAADQLKVAFGS